MWGCAHRVFHQQPEVNYFPRFSPQLISLERYTLSVYRAGEIDLFENLDIVHIRLLVVARMCVAAPKRSRGRQVLILFCAHRVLL